MTNLWRAITSHAAWSCCSFGAWVATPPVRSPALPTGYRWRRWTPISGACSGESFAGSRRSAGHLEIPRPEICWTLAEWALPLEDTYSWQQALMDLGATVCLSRRPLCSRCPIAGCCIAYAETAQPTLFPEVMPTAVERERPSRPPCSRGGGSIRTGSGTTPRSSPGA